MKHTASIRLVAIWLLSHHAAYNFKFVNEEIVASSFALPKDNFVSKQRVLHQRDSLHGMAAVLKL